MLDILDMLPIANGIVGQFYRSKSKEFGDAFERFIILEVRAYLSYHRKNEAMSYWRSTSQFEVDLIIGTSIAIEVKSTELISDKHLKGLRALAEEGIMKRLICSL